jgi:hypothetical protein
MPVPAPAKLSLTVAKSATSVQFVPSQYSVFATLGGFCEPPKANASV